MREKPPVPEFAFEAWFFEPWIVTAIILSSAGVGAVLGFILGMVSWIGDSCSEKTEHHIFSYPFVLSLVVALLAAFFWALGAAGVYWAKYSIYFAKLWWGVDYDPL